MLSSLPHTPSSPSEECLNQFQNLLKNKLGKIIMAQKTSSFFALSGRTFLPYPTLINVMSLCSLTRDIFCGYVKIKDQYFTCDSRKVQTLLAFKYM